MYGDKIFCLNPFCKTEFKDITRIKFQDSRYGKFKNDCPICHGTNTINPIRPKDLNTKSNNIRLERVKKYKYIRCWYCKNNGIKILDKFGCCTRCGTNLKLYPTMKKLPYPRIDNYTLSKEVLGQRKQFDLANRTTIIPNDITLCNLDSAKQELHLAHIDEFRETDFNFSITQTSIPTRQMIDMEFRPCYQKEKKMEAKPNLRKIYNSWRYGYE